MTGPRLREPDARRRLSPGGHGRRMGEDPGVLVREPPINHPPGRKSRFVVECSHYGKQ